MCKEDVRLGRHAEAIVTLDGALTGAAQRVAIGNPNRRSLIVSVFFTNIVDPIAIAVVRAASGSGPVLGVVNVYNPTLVLTVETHGDGVLGAVWVTGVNPDDQVMVVTEVRWNKELGDI